MGQETMNPPANYKALREKMADLMIQTYYAVRRDNPQASKDECEQETTRLLEQWMKECR